MTVLCAALALYAFWVEPSSLRVGRVSLAVLPPGSRPLRVAVLSDLHVGSPYRGIHRLRDTVDPVILISHSPDIFPEVPRRVLLTLAGHTHGGQVRFPILGAPAIPSRYWQRYAGGHIMEGGRHLFVSTGIGTSAIPVRFNVPPTIFVLELKPAAPGERT